MSIMITPMEDTSITITALGGLGTIMTPTAATEALGMSGRRTLVTATPLTATAIRPESWDTGGRMRGIMRAVTLIITGSKRKENVNE
jgi:hypothetical protein